MTDFVMPLVLEIDVSSLTMALVNIASPQGAVTSLADSVHAALQTHPQLQVSRIGDTVIATSHAGLGGRVVVLARLHTAPCPPDPLAYVEMGKLFGPAACDAKGALAIALKTAAAADFSHDVTFVFLSGGQDLDGLLSGSDVLRTADLVLVAEPTASTVRVGALGHPRAEALAVLSDRAVVADGSSPVLALLASEDVPALAFGPGDPSVAGRPDEYVSTAELTQCEFAVRQWLAEPPSRR